MERERNRGHFDNPIPTYLPIKMACYHSDGLIIDPIEIW